MKKKLSERPMRSLMVAWEIAHTGSPCMMAIKISDNSFQKDIISEDTF